MNMKPTKAHALNREKFLFLVSGLVDDGQFLEKVSKIREYLGIPSNGFKNVDDYSTWYEQFSRDSDAAIRGGWFKSRFRSLNSKDSDFEDKNYELHKLIPLNFLTYSIEEIIRENPDLKDNFKGPIYDYIVWGSISTPTPWSIVSKYKNFGKPSEKHEISLVPHNPLNSDDYNHARGFLDALHEHERSVAPKESAKNPEKEIEVLILTNKKGEEIPSTAPDIEKDGVYSDLSIAIDVLDENKLDGDEEKLKNSIRTKRKRARDRAKQHYPKSYKEKR